MSEPPIRSTYPACFILYWYKHFKYTLYITCEVLAVAGNGLTAGPLLVLPL